MEGPPLDPNDKDIAVAIEFWILAALVLGGMIYGIVSGIATLWRPAP